MQGSSQLAIITDIEPGGPSNALPPRQGPVDPGYGVVLPPVVDNSPPDRPSTWPPQRPNYPVDPGYGLPTFPNVWPNPPLVGGPAHPIRLPPLVPTHPIYTPPEVSPPIAIPPGAVWPPLPPGLPRVLIALVWIVGVGYRWAVLDGDAAIPTPPIADTGPDAEPK